MLVIKRRTAGDASGTGALTAYAPAGARGGAWDPPDSRRGLQLTLATFWLIDGLFQLQAFMFSPSFGRRMILPVASGNPSAVSRPIHWVGLAISHNPQPANAAFALTQLLVALGIAWRPTVKPALAASAFWGLAVWWFGEGLGGILNGTADPVTGAPGAVIVYVLLAMLLWPTQRSEHSERFVAAQSVGELPAKALWVFLWGSLAALAVSGANRSAGHTSSLLRAGSVGQPSWLAGADRHVASLVAHDGLQLSVAMALWFALVAGAVFVGGSTLRAVIVAGSALLVALWVLGQDFGGVFTGTGTDPNVAPLLVLLSICYWPLRAGTARATAADGSR